MASNEGTGAASAAPTLDELAVEIRVELDAVDAAKDTALAHAIRAGELLTQAKKRMGHGAWLPWLKENFAGHYNSAGNYMRLAANSQRVVNLGSIREALAEIRTSTPRKKRASSREVIDGLWQNEDVLAWVKKRMKAGTFRDGLMAESKAGLFGWPVIGEHLPQNAADRCIAIIKDRDRRPRERKPEAGKLLRDVQRRRKAGDDRDNKLWQARMDILQNLSDIERIDFPKYGIRDADADTVVEIYEYLTLLDAWTQRSLVELGAHIDDLAKLRLIRKLRDVTGRDPAEAKLFLEAADRLEAKRLGLKTGS